MTPVALAVSALLLTSGCSAAPGMDMQLRDYGQNPPRLMQSTDATTPAFADFVSALSMDLRKAGHGVGDLRITRIPLREAMTSPPSEAVLPQGTCLTSPWAALDVVMQDGERRVTGDILWNERQFLRDRAAQAAWPDPPAAFPQEVYATHAQSYAATLGQTGAAPAAVPADLERLFRAAPRSTRGPFGEAALGTMAALAAEASTPYRDHLVALVEHCLTGQPPLRLSTIDEVRSAIGPNDYTRFVFAMR